MLTVSREQMVLTYCLFSVSYCWRGPMFGVLVAVPTVKALTASQLKLNLQSITDCGHAFTSTLLLRWVEWNSLTSDVSGTSGPPESACSVIRTRKSKSTWLLRWAVACDGCFLLSPRMGNVVFSPFLSVGHESLWNAPLPFSICPKGKRGGGGSRKTYFHTSAAVMHRSGLWRSIWVVWEFRIDAAAQVLARRVCHSTHTHSPYESVPRRVLCHAVGAVLAM